MKRAYDYDHLIDGSPMLSPDADVELNFEDLGAEESGFDEAKFYHRFVWRFDRRSWKFKYSFLTREEFLYLRSLYKKKTTFMFTFLNDENEVETVPAYCISGNVVYQSKRSGLYKNFSLEIIEC